MLGKIKQIVFTHHISAMPRYSSEAIRALSSPAGTATQNDEECNIQALRDLLEQGLDEGYEILFLFY